MVAGSALAICLLLSLWGTGDLCAQTTDTDDVIQFYQSRVAADPDDFFNYNKLGAAYIQKARETGDMTYYELAEHALQRSLALVSDQPNAATATTSLAMISLAKHRFQEALAYAQRALGHDPGVLYPHAIVGDAYLEMGEYEQAAAAYARLLPLQGPRYPHSRLAYLQFLRGDPQGAMQQMRQAVEAAMENNAPPEHVAWSQIQLGDLWVAVGDVRQAETIYSKALETFPGSHRALASLANVRTAQQHYQEAIAFYHKAIAIIPLPEYVAALGDVYRKIGQHQAAKQQYDLVEYIGRLNTLNQVIYNRELALFYADHDMQLPEALSLARRELEVRHDIMTYDVLAWALYKNDQPQEARAAITEAIKLGTQDARLFFHAGMIHYRLGEIDQAKSYLQRALAMHPRFHVFYADVAQQTLAALAARLD